MGSVLGDGQQAQLELAGLKRTLKWTNIQREQLLDRLDLLRLDNQRLQERVEDLERQLAEARQQQALFWRRFGSSPFAPLISCLSFSSAA